MQCCCAHIANFWNLDASTVVAGHQAHAADIHCHEGPQCTLTLSLVKKPWSTCLTDWVKKSLQLHNYPDSHRHTHTVPYYNPLSRTTWVGWYQKQHSPSHRQLAQNMYLVIFSDVRSAYLCINSVYTARTNRPSLTRYGQLVTRF